MKNYLLPSLLLLVVLFVACSKDDDPAPPVNQKKVTYIVMVALDDGIAYLPDGGYDGLNPVLVEYPEVSTELDQVVAVVNFNDKYRNENGIKGTEYYHYKNGKRITLESTPTIQKIGEDSQYVTKIIDLAVTNAPADEYMLIFNSHGGGWDDTDAEDPISRSTLAVNDTTKKMGKSLSLNRLLKGYKNSMLAQQGKKLKAIYYDNCLMHTIENLSEIADIAEYSLGTPNVSISATQANTYLINSIRNSTEFETSLTQAAAYINSTCAKDGQYGCSGL
ncbi:MAG: clostripain-related cysteine peptidase [Bacteroidales bacterium]